MTLAEVSAYLHVHASTIYRLLKRRQLPAFRVGAEWRFRREDIDRWRLGQSPGQFSERGPIGSNKERVNC